MITKEFITAANEAAASTGFINPDFRACCNADGEAMTFRSLYTFDGVNGKGESMIIEVTTGEDSGHKNSLPRLWYKAGYTPAILRRYWCVNTYVTAAAPTQPAWAKYNPQYTPDYKTNFSYMLEATPENLAVILAECAKRFKEAK